MRAQVLVSAWALIALVGSAEVVRSGGAPRALLLALGAAALAAYVALVRDWRAFAPYAVSAVSALVLVVVGGFAPLDVAVPVCAALAVALVFVAAVRPALVLGLSPKKNLDRA